MLKAYRNYLIKFIVFKYFEEFENFYYYNNTSNIKSKINLSIEYDKFNLKENCIGDYYQNLTIYKNNYWVISSYMINKKFVNKNENQKTIK